MKDIHEYEKDLSSIRMMMERSVKFISLSGLSGVLAGIYALAGAALAYLILSQSGVSVYENSPSADTIQQLILVASSVLVLSIATGIIFSIRKAKRLKTTFWNNASRRLCINLAVPLVAGGCFVLIVLSQGHFALAAPATLIFYGLALLQASEQTFEEIRYLGLSEVVIGLVALLFPGYGLMFWAFGFGVLHIIYGSIMHFRYDK